MRESVTLILPLLAMIKKVYLFKKMNRLQYVTGLVYTMPILCTYYFFSHYRFTPLQTKFEKSAHPIALFYLRSNWNLGPPLERRDPPGTRRLHCLKIDQFYWENVQEYVIHGYNWPVLLGNCSGICNTWL